MLLVRTLKVYMQTTFIDKEQSKEAFRLALGYENMIHFTHMHKHKHVNEHTHINSQP